MPAQDELWPAHASNAHDGFVAEPGQWPVARDWQPFVDRFFESEAGRSLLAELRQRLKQGETIFPVNPLRALLETPASSVRVVVLGQDPYPTLGHADGLAFSAAKGRPKSLARIAEVLAADRPGWLPPTHSRLDAWARQGALMLNTALTVCQGQAGSHLNVGWHLLTQSILKELGRYPEIHFLLWGAKAQDFADAAWQESSLAPRCVHRSRHPSYDFHKQFMASGSHFLATAHLVDWWSWQ